MIMKITTFDPIIVSPKADDLISVFEALGFEKSHAPVTATSIGDVKSTRMKHPDGYHVDIADVKERTEDKVHIRINVDNFEEAYDILLKHGFKNRLGENKTYDSKSSKAATMLSPSGFVIALVQHKK